MSRPKGLLLFNIDMDLKSSKILLWEEGKNGKS